MKKLPGFELLAIALLCITASAAVRGCWIMMDVHKSMMETAADDRDAADFQKRAWDDTSGKTTPMGPSPATPAKMRPKSSKQ